METPRVILHLDMDAFFAAVEQRDRPELQGLPVIVGGSPASRGVVCAASYEARRFGVRSAMPSRTAGRLCPQGIFLSPRMDRYRDESRAIFGLVAASGVEIEQVSVDEAYLDASGLRLATDSEEALVATVGWARALKARIRAARRLTASIGIASNKLMAKVASDWGKPDGLILIPDRDRAAFLRPLPARTLHGVGRVTEEVLLRAGIRTVGDLQDHPGDLKALVGSWGPVLRAFAFGIDERPLSQDDTVKSIGSETTLPADTADRPTLRAILKEQAAEVAAKLQRHGLAAQTVQVKVRYGDFSTLTRQYSFDEPVSEARDLYRLACWLLARHRLVDRPLRLLGSGVGGLVETRGRQLVFDWRDRPAEPARPGPASTALNPGNRTG
ncbi:MAG: DNA polymerase IV [Verrucomicrobia bacterium]|nr:DNA polymerase IV [Verrucomicrobiota bacterium]